jgi:hypothetical protein
MSRTAAIALVLSCLGLILMTVGIALVCVPAAVIFAGGSMAAMGLFVIDVDKKQTPRRPPPP